MTNICQIQWLGHIEFKPALQLQRRLVAKRAANEIPNTLLLLEHPPTFTIGFDGHRQHLLSNQAELARQNIQYYEVDRGGSVSYQGPGQLVGSAILSLRDFGDSYHTYISKLESLLIRTLRHFNIHAFRQQTQRGVWVMPTAPGPGRPAPWAESDDHAAKIGCVGVKVNAAQITSYGFTLNVAPNLDYFDLIVPRGLQGCKVTSLQKILNKPVKIRSVIDPVIQSFCEVFDLEPQLIDPSAFPDEESTPHLTLM